MDEYIVAILSYERVRLTRIASISINHDEFVSRSSQKDACVSVFCSLPNLNVNGMSHHPHHAIISDEDNKVLITVSGSTIFVFSTE